MREDTLHSHVRTMNLPPKKSLGGPWQVFGKRLRTDETLREGRESGIIFPCCPKQRQ